MLPLQAPKQGKYQYTLAKVMNLISLVQHRFSDHCIVYNHVHNCVLWVSYSAAVSMLFQLCLSIQLLANICHHCLHVPTTNTVHVCSLRNL